MKIRIPNTKAKDIMKTIRQIPDPEHPNQEQIEVEYQDGIVLTILAIHIT